MAWMAWAARGGLFAVVASCSHWFSQGQPVGRCKLSRRAERASRPGTVMSCAWIVLVVALAWKADARLPAARVRLERLIRVQSTAGTGRAMQTASSATARGGRAARGALGWPSLTPACTKLGKRGAGRASMRA